VRWICSSMFHAFDQINETLLHNILSLLNVMQQNCIHQDPTLILISGIKCCCIASMQTEYQFRVFSSFVSLFLQLRSVVSVTLFGVRPNTFFRRVITNTHTHTYIYIYIYIYIPLKDLKDIQIRLNYINKTYNFMCTTSVVQFTFYE